MIPIIFGLTHFCFIIFLAILIARSNDPVAVNGWLIVLPLDFPVSLGLFPIAYFDGESILSSRNSLGDYSIFRDLDNFWIPALYSGIVGSYWWYLLAKFFVKVFMRSS